MATTVPPLDRMYLLTASIGMILYGINVVMFCGVVYVLTIKRKNKVVAHRLLLATSVVLCLLVSFYVALSIQQLLEAFVSGPFVGLPEGPILYFAQEGSKIEFGKEMLYVAAVLVQDLVLIWRLWAVFGQDWRVVILPLALEAFHTSAATIASVLVYQGASIGAHSIKVWGLSGWSTDLIINIGLTLIIATKLWWAGRLTVDIRANKGNAYLGAMFVMLESGGMFALVTFILFVCYLIGSTQVYALVGLNVVCQLAALSPMLIIVRVGLGLTHASNVSTYVSSARIQPLSAPKFVSRSAGALGVEIDISTTNDSGNFYNSKDAYPMRDIKASA